MNETAPATQAPGKRATILVSVVALLCVLIPFLFWRGTWFGLPLSDQQITEYLEGAREEPRRAQHALAQISDRVSAGDTSVDQWQSQLVALAGHSLPQLRLTAAWVMGQKPGNEPFHAALRELLADPDPMVRRNAALSLANFRDPAARPELLAMLSPQTVTTDRAGTITNRRSEGDSIEQGAMLARLTVEGEAEPLEVRSTVPGVVRTQFFPDGSAVAPGDTVALLGPDPAHVFEALRALYLVGTREDLEAIRPFLRAAGPFPANVAEQARLTSERIRQGITP